MSRETGRPGQPGEARVWRVVLVILLFACLLRVAAGFALRDSFLERGNSHTPLTATARNLAHGGGFAIEPGMPSVDYEPLYPVLMALGYRVTGFNWLGITLLQTILAFGSGLLVYLIGCRAADPIAGAVGAAYIAVYPYLFTYSISIGDTTLFVFLILLLIYLSLAVDRASTWRWAVATGCVAGLGLLTRGSMVALLPPVVLYVVVRLNRNQQLRLLPVLAMGFVLTLAPWLARNYALTGEWLISTHGGFGLWQGNNPHSLRLIGGDKSVDEVYLVKPAPEIYQRYPMAPRPPREAVHVARVYRDEATSFIRRNPAELAHLAWVKLVKMWSWNRNPRSSAPVFGDNDARQVVYFISYVPLLIGLAAGFPLLLRRMPQEALLLGGMLATYTAAHMIVMGFTRARLPIDPILMVFLGVAVSAATRRWLGRVPSVPAISNGTSPLPMRVA